MRYAEPDSFVHDIIKTSIHDHLLTPERLEVQATARAFARYELMPIANELDPQQKEFPPSLLERMGELGYFGVTIPTEYGGMGLGVFEYCLVAEELARAWMSAASIIARAQGLGTQIGDANYQDELRRRSARGDWIGAVALSEPNAGSDLAAVECRAALEGDEWVINGEKRWCGNALNADFIAALVRVKDPEPGQPRAAGLTTLIIEKERGKYPKGLTGSPIEKIGYFGMTTFALQFDDVRIPASHKVGSAKSSSGDKASTAAFKATQAGLNIARVHTAARAIGLARAALEDSLDYAASRVQFGKPIGEQQVIRFKLADMATRIEHCRSMMYAVAHTLDQGGSAERESAMVKLHATEMAVDVTGEAIQIHGGNGYTTEFAVERYWRDARLTTIFEGTSEIQRRIISSRLLPKQRRTKPEGS